MNAQCLLSLSVFILSPPCLSCAPSFYLLSSHLWSLLRTLAEWLCAENLQQLCQVTELLTLLQTEADWPLPQRRKHAAGWGSAPAAQPILLLY